MNEADIAAFQSLRTALDKAEDTIARQQRAIGRKDAELLVIANIARGSGTINSFPNIYKIAFNALAYTGNGGEG